MRVFFMAMFFLISEWGGAQAPSPSGKMVAVKGGWYLPLYSLDSQKVWVKPFEMDIYAVTNADFQRFVLDYPEWQRGKAKGLYVDASYLQHWTSATEYDPALAQSPVTNVSWFAAKAYCACQGKRLPSIAEWEFAAKASSKKADATKDPEFYQWILDWASKTSPKVLPAVGTTFRNYYGIYDLHGLVWEWTYDFSSALTTGESRGNSDLDGMLFCGGGSFSSKDVSNYAAFLRFAMRSSLKAKYSVPNLGFRCVR